MDRDFLNQEIERRYEELRGLVFASAYTMRLSKQDAEDALQDLFVEILEEQLEPDTWKQRAYTIVGRTRTRKYREIQKSKRLANLPPT